MTDTPRRTGLLIVLDGFGYSSAIDGNAIAAATHPDVGCALDRRTAHADLRARVRTSGLPSGQMGNSEVGHMNLGAGRVVYQDLTRISLAIETGEFARNAVINRAIEAAKGSALHVLGLLSPGGVHSHEDHLFALIAHAAASGVTRIYLHAFLDGRDTPPKSAKASLARADAEFAKLGVGQTASIVGRYFAMDRDQRWDRVERAYNLLVRGEAPFHAEDARRRDWKLRINAAKATSSYNPPPFMPRTTCRSGSPTATQSSS